MNNLSVVDFKLFDELSSVLVNVVVLNFPSMYKHNGDYCAFKHDYSGLSSSNASKFGSYKVVLLLIGDKHFNGP